jgi:hypothetical protein
MQAVKGHLAAMRHKGQGYAEGGVMNVYRCERCQKFHVGTAPAWSLKRDNRAADARRDRKERLREMRAAESQEDDCG